MRFRLLPLSLVLGLAPLGSVYSASSSSSSSSSPREGLIKLLANNPKGHLDKQVRGEFENLLKEYEKEGLDPDDILCKIGASVFGIDNEPLSRGPVPHQEGEHDEDACIVAFNYMKQFMKDVFMSYGISADRADTCAEVLVEADRRGIDSHGLGRLKPVSQSTKGAGRLSFCLPLFFLTW